MEKRYRIREERKEDGVIRFYPMYSEKSYSTDNFEPFKDYKVINSYDRQDGSNAKYLETINFSSFDEALNFINEKKQNSSLDIKIYDID
jgi:hypothetical protein